MGDGYVRLCQGFAQLQGIPSLMVGIVFHWPAIMHRFACCCKSDVDREM